MEGGANKIERDERDSSTAKSSLHALKALANVRDRDYDAQPHVPVPIHPKDGKFVFHNYASRLQCGATLIACDVLNFFDDWRSLESLGEYKPAIEPAVLEDPVAALVRATLLRRSDQATAPEEEAMSKFDAWNPEAGFFHSATKNVWLKNGQEPAECLLPQPPDPNLRPASTKHYGSAESVSLPRPHLDVPLTNTLLARRSWRQFGPGTIPLPTFANLLAFTAGIQQWVTVPGQGRMALKTSPSGGARHPVELYVLAWGIEGLEKGLYHYAPDVHALEVVQAGLDSSRVPIYLPNGDYWSKACAVILFSAVYDRELWRYGYSRAYRAPFIEAGHLCQTFCVLATEYGLAPFCAMALADTAIETDLRIDGVTESVLYVAGVGVRPDGIQWAPAPDGFAIPQVEPNPHLQPR